MTKQPPTDPYAGWTDSELADYARHRAQSRHDEAERVAEKVATRAAQARASTSALLNPDTAALIGDDTDEED